MPITIDGIPVNELVEQFLFELRGEEGTGENVALSRDDVLLLMDLDDNSNINEDDFRLYQSRVGQDSALFNQSQFLLFADDLIDSRICDHASEEQYTVTANQPIATFNLGSSEQACIAQNLTSFLSSIDFDQANQRIHPTTYGSTPIYDTHESREVEIRGRLARATDLSSEARLAVRFFMYNERLPLDLVEQLFASQPSLLPQLRTLGLVITQEVNGETLYQMNNLTLVSHRLPNNEVMYLFSDLPHHLQRDHFREATAQVSQTSYILLNYLQDQYRVNGEDAHQGLMADFGSGTGILALAMLRMYPGITEAMAVEIDPQSMNLSRFNAMLSGVEDRWTVVNNDPISNFTQALDSRELDLAISNPPFNVAAEANSEEFTDFGDGGDVGLEVTSIFLNEALPNLREGARFIAYSHLPYNQERDYFLVSHLREHFSGYSLTLGELQLDSLRTSAEEYARGFSVYLSEERRFHRLLEAQARMGSANLLMGLSHIGRAPVDEALAAAIEEHLAQQHIAGFRPMIWSLTQGEDASVAVQEIEVVLPYFNPSRHNRPVRRPPGGVFIQQELLPVR